MTSSIGFRSHYNQILLNYFDEKDVRVRRGRYTIDAQLLNAAAQQVEVTGLRLGREVGAATLHSCPANIDNQGSYWKQRLPSNIDLTVTSHTVLGTIGGSTVELLPYDDQLQAPTGVRINSSIDPIALSNSLLFKTYGVGDTTTQSWAAQRLGPFVPVMANRIHFWVDGPGYYGLNVTVRITGQRAPVPAWADAQTTTSEKISLLDLGWAQSKFAWASIRQIQILNLPVGVNLSAYTGAFSLPMQIDPTRPYTNSDNRDVLFDRYWTSGDGMLTEMYLESDYAGWRYANSYLINIDKFSALAVEPNAWGMFAASGSMLHYFDRREPMPGSLQASALYREPYYGLEVSIDETRLSPVKFVVLSPTPYSAASLAGSYRFLVTVPDGTMYALTPDGFFVEYTRDAGWRTGIPPTISIPLAATGTYVFHLQAIGPDGVVVQDGVPCINPAFSPLASFDLSSLVSDIQGLSFDDRGRLWLWTGSQAVALSFRYDAYIIDQATQAIYMTDLVDTLTVDGVSISSGMVDPTTIIFVNSERVGPYVGRVSIEGGSL